METMDRLDLAALLEALEGDADFLEELFAAGVIERCEAYTRDHLADICVARTLVRELEVNWPGVEIILRLRGELLATRHQLVELARLLAERGGG